MSAIDELSSGGINMKKFAAGLLLAMALMSTTTAYAARNPVYSPEVTPPVDVPPEEPSPKTSDFNILYAEGAGLLFVGAAVVAGVKSNKKKDA